MAATHASESKADQLTSAEEVMQQWAERALDELSLELALARNQELGIAAGVHYHRQHRMEISMLTNDLDPEAAPENVIRQSIVTRGSEIHHYLFDTATGDVVLVPSEIRAHPDTGDPLLDTTTPPLIEQASEDYSSVSFGRGYEYSQFILERAKRMGYYATEAAATQYVIDTEGFLTEPGIHTRPNVIPLTYVNPPEKFTDS